MANLTTVGLTAGAGSSGTGTVSTLDNVIGTAGTPSANVQTVQGVTSMTPLKVDGSAVTQPVSIASLPSGAVTNAGTFAVQVTSAPSIAVTLATNTPTLQTGTNVVGKVGINDGTSALVLSPASSGAPAATVVAVPVTIRDVNPNGGTTAANSAPVVNADQYSTHKEVAASQTAAVLGATGAIGDYLSHVTVFPGTAACGVVTILDAASTVGTFPGGGTTALPSLVPFMIPVGAFCTGAGWKITTGTNVTVTAVGKFT